MGLSLQDHPTRVYQARKALLEADPKSKQKWKKSVWLQKKSGRSEAFFAL